MFLGFRWGSRWNSQQGCPENVGEWTCEQILRLVYITWCAIKGGRNDACP